MSETGRYAWVREEIGEAFALGDRETAETLICGDWRLLRYAIASLRDDKELVMIAVGENRLTNSVLHKANLL